MCTIDVLAKIYKLSSDRLKNTLFLQWYSLPETHTDDNRNWTIGILIIYTMKSVGWHLSFGNRKMWSLSIPNIVILVFPCPFHNEKYRLSLYTVYSCNAPLKLLPACQWQVNFQFWQLKIAYLLASLVRFIFQLFAWNTTN